MLGILIWLAVSARHWFKGPKVNIEHQMLGREGNVVEGREAAKDSGGSSTDSIKKDEARRMDHEKAGALP